MPLKVLATTRSIAIAAGKGGVGKSTFTLLLAGALKRRGEKVGILDADLYGPSLRQMLPEQRLPKQDAGKIMPGMAGGIQTISLAYFQQEAAVRAPVANRLLSHFFQNVIWDVTQLLVDFPPGTGDIPITAIQAGGLSGAVIVTTPQKVALLDVRKTLALFHKTGVPILGIAENMSGPVFGNGGGRILAEEFGVPFLGSIPLDPAIREAGDSGTLLDLEYADSMVEKLGEGQRDPVTEIFPSEGGFRIVWKGGEQSVLTAPSVQNACPCVRCREGPRIEQNVVFLGYERKGGYGLRFDFSSGCSYGIYDFVLLKGLGRLV